MKRSAEFSECGKYRYLLSREWDDTKPYAMCIGLNPSTANGTKDDATIRILIKVLTRLGFGGLKMVNLYSCITSKPKNIFNFLNPEVPHYAWLTTTAFNCQTIIFCWGIFPEAVHRAKKMKTLFPGAKCFGKNQYGSPLHPMALMWQGIINDVQLTHY